MVLERQWTKVVGAVLAVVGAVLVAVRQWNVDEAVATARADACVRTAATAVPWYQIPSGAISVGLFVTAIVLVLRTVGRVRALWTPVFVLGLIVLVLVTVLEIYYTIDAEGIEAAFHPDCFG